MRLPKEFVCALPQSGADMFVWAATCQRHSHTKSDTPMEKDTYRVVTHTADGKLRIKDYVSKKPLMRLHSQIGIEDCSTDLELRGLPVFRDLIGPMPEGDTIIRYESPEVFEALTKDWDVAKPVRKSRRRSRNSPAT